MARFLAEYLGKAFDPHAMSLMGEQDWQFEIWHLHWALPVLASLPHRLDKRQSPQCRSFHICRIGPGNSLFEKLGGPQFTLAEMALRIYQAYCSNRGNPETVSLEDSISFLIVFCDATQTI